MLWFNLACVIGFALSTIFIVRRKAMLADRLAALGLHAAIWVLLWSLANPPVWLPALLAQVSNEEIAEPSKSSALKSRDQLRDHPPVRLELVESPDTQRWAPDWPREIALGEPLIVTIEGFTAQDGITSFSLEDPYGNLVDTDTLNPQTPRLTLHDQPKLAGPWEYRLRIESDTAKREQVLPVVVHTPEKPAVLLWLASPGFESAALSRWLRQSGTPAQVVTQLAPDMARRESLNGLSIRESNLLDGDTSFDLLILDSRLWPQLSPAQRKNLHTIAQEKSLLWLLHSDLDTDFLRYAQNTGMTLGTARSQTISYMEATDAQSAPELRLVGWQPQSVSDRDPMLKSDQRALYWARSEAQSSVGFVFFNDSYRWHTSGFSDNFARLWSSIFDTQLAWRGGRTPITVRTELPLVQERVTLCSRSFETSAPEITALAKDRDLLQPMPAVFEGRDSTGFCYSVWPNQSGWHQIEKEGFEFFVFEQGSWPEWQNQIVFTGSSEMAAARLGAVSQYQSADRTVPRYWIALILLCLLIFIWWRERGSL